MKLVRKVVLAWMFAWLPLSGAMATTMPFCAQGMVGSAQSGMPAEDGAAMPCHPSATDSMSTDAPLPVEHCDLCHIAGALVPPTLPYVANVAPGLAPLDAAVIDFRSFFPETPQRPPHTAPA